MTVCTAAIFRWNYGMMGEEDFGPAIVTAADRMLTDEGLGIEFERDYAKSGYLTPRVLALVASSIPIHSAIMKAYIPRLREPLVTNVTQIAHGYAKQMRDYGADRAAEKTLSPLKLDHETFLSRQREMDPTLVMELANEMRDYQLQAEALVVGCDDERAHLYHIDNRGIVTCHDDIGFVSAGIGGVHSSAQFMFAEYINTWPYYYALYMTYLAKKRAEAAPGCGTRTDMHVILRDNSWRLDYRTIGELDKIFAEQKEAQRKGVTVDVERLMNFEKKWHEEEKAAALAKEQTESQPLRVEVDKETPPGPVQSNDGP